MNVSVSQLFLYPIKSCAGIEVSRAAVEPRGFQYDRRWMIVDSQNRFMTQRRHPKLALIRTSIRENRLEVSAPGVSPLILPLRESGTSTIDVIVWEDTVRASRTDQAAGEWFSEVLGSTCQPVWMSDQSNRAVDPDYATDNQIVSFADAFPFLLLSEASLDDLNRRLPQPLPMNRFRPNIVISGCGPFDEDRWTSFRIGGTVFRCAKPCSRCATTTVDQATGETGKEPLATLAQFRSRGGKVYFGQNLLHKGRGAISVGDPIELFSPDAR